MNNKHLVPNHNLPALRAEHLAKEAEYVAANTVKHGRWTIVPATGRTGGAKNIGVVMTAPLENDRYFRNVSEATTRADQLDLPSVNQPTKRKGLK